MQSQIPSPVAIDGKTVRRSMNGGNSSCSYNFGVGFRSNLVVGQVKTEAKSNEIKAIPELLEMLALKNALVSIDAMGCQKEIAERIISRKAGYLLAVKGNQRSLQDELPLVFDDLYDADMSPLT